MINNLEIHMQQIYAKPYLPFQSLRGIIQKIIKRSNNFLQKHPKVFSFLISLEQKTIVFDIDETLVYATESK